MSITVDTPPETGTDTSAPDKVKRNPFSRREPDTLLTGALPHVNLLDGEQRRARQTQRARTRLVAAAAGLCAIAAITWIAATGLVIAADHRLTTAEETAGQLDTTEKRLAPVATLDNHVATARGAVEQAAAEQIDVQNITSTITGQLAAAGGRIISLSITGTGATPDANQATGAVNPCGAGSDPFQPSAALGCVKFSGTIPNRDRLAALLETLNGSGIIADTAITDSTVGDGGQVSFTATTLITNQATQGQTANGATP